MKLTIKEVIEHYRGLTSISTAELAECIGFKRRCLYTRYKEPETWRIGELRNAYNLLRVPEEDRIYNEEGDK